MAAHSKPSRPVAPYRKPGFWRRLRSGNPSDVQLGYLLLAPALLTLALVMLYPVLTVLWQAVHGEHLLRPWQGSPFVGLEHFQKMLWGRNMTWDLGHLSGLRLLALAVVAVLWWQVSRGRLGRGVALGWSLGLLLVFGVLMGFHPGEGGRWGDPRFWNAFNITLIIMVVSVIGSFVVGLPLALLANVESPLRWLGRVALLLPWAMPRAFTGLTFAWLFQSDYGVVNDLLGRLGVTALLQVLLDSQLFGNQGLLWLSREMPAIVAVNITLIWKTSSFVALILLAGLQSIDRSLYEAATVDGANAWQRFWRITLPLLRPAVAVALIFRTLTAIQTFDIPFAMTRGGPGRTLETLGLYVYNTVTASNIGYAAALSVSLFVISLLITIFYLRWIFTDE
ncbi:MAG: sugar ABC transporter permease [Trueperaceae bacterium]|nr:MAG: sugar ABC transporter permease [Trueperaceae bacterium]